MSAIRVAVKKSWTNRPPHALGESKWWHACCLYCWRKRKSQSTTHPAHAVPGEETCCFCGERKTTFRIRVSPRATRCTHWREH